MAPKERATKGAMRPSGRGRRRVRRMRPSTSRSRYMLMALAAATSRVVPTSAMQRPVERHLHRAPAAAPAPKVKTTSPVTRGLASCDEVAQRRPAPPAGRPTAPGVLRAFTGRRRLTADDYLALNSSFSSTGLPSATVTSLVWVP